MANQMTNPINFHAQHAPMGAYFSFTCGHFGSKGGFGLQNGRPGNQDLFIGFKRGRSNESVPLELLPFFQGAADDTSASFLVGQQPSSAPASPGLRAVEKGSIRREYGWATDRWITPDMRFSIHTPFGSIPDPSRAGAAELRSALVPAIVAELEVHNRGTVPYTGCFALKFDERGIQPLADVGSGRVGFAIRNHIGMLAEIDGGAAPTPMLRFSVEAAFNSANAVHRLGYVPGFSFEVPPGEVRRLRVALGVYIKGDVTSGLAGEYLYTSYFGGLTDVLTFTLDGFEAQGIAASRIDADLANSPLSSDQKFLIAHATRSYYGNTQLLRVAGEPCWIVNEGEYCMMNTLDLSVDQVFWELEQNPWVVRNLLDRFVTHYSYHDEVRAPATGIVRRGGISFCHDMGAHNVFSPKGESSYELPHLPAKCFSFMTCEQLCNWVLCAASYVRATGDVAWARQQVHVIEACLGSLINRCSEEGIVAYESMRCGPDGAEITTYDSLDHSLAQTRNNLYMATKCWATFLGLEHLLSDLSLPDQAILARNYRVRAEQAVCNRAGKDGVLPAVFESDNPGYHSRILPAVEGLLYPLQWGLEQEQDSPALYETLRQHAAALLNDPERRNLFLDGGIRLSSTSDNSWMSKIAIAQHVVRHALGLAKDRDISELLSRADAAHVRWQTEGASAYWACTDQMVSGTARGSRYYPRVITTALWLASAIPQEEANYHECAKT